MIRRTTGLAATMRGVFASVLTTALASALLGARAEGQQRAKPISTASIPAARMALEDTIRSTDTNAITGTLPNGLTYYIRRNAKPEGRAMLQLIVKAGSLQEDEDQRGLAHFVEHMAFNGTTHFRKHELINYLESIGLTFGSDLNASTTFENTSYLLRVPTDDAAIVEKAFVVLSDWAGEVTFDSAEVVSERGVVIEEWRRSLGAGTRISKKQMPVIFHDSRYAVREPIGLPDIIRSANPSVLKRFYRDWYRPNLMAVVAVGDFDPARIRTLIERQFSALTNPPSPRPLQSAPIPDHAGTLFSVASDSEVVNPQVSVMYKLPQFGNRTVRDYLESLERSCMQGALQTRVSEILQTIEPPFLMGGAQFSGIGMDRATFSVLARTKKDKVMSGLGAVFMEVERIARFGITEDEVARCRKMLLNGVNQTFTERANVVSEAYAGIYAADFLTPGGITQLDPVTQVALYKQLVPMIRAEQAKRWASLWRTPDNRIVTIQIPAAPDALAPDSASLLMVLDNITRQTLAAHVEHVKMAPILDRLPTPGKIVAKKQHEQSITEWTLSNGAQVFLRPSTNTADRIGFSGQSIGGYYLEADKGYVPATTAASVVAAGGLGKFSRIDLSKQLAGRDVQINVSIAPYTEAIAGETSSSDLELALQMTYLTFTAPRVDSTAIAVMKEQLRNQLDARKNNPQAAFFDTVTVTMAQHHPLARLLTQAWIDSIDAVKSLAAYRSRFGDASDFRFIFVGNFDPDTLAPLVERYIGGLPSRGRKETARDMGVVPPTGLVRRTVVGGHEPRTYNLISFYGPFKLTFESEWQIKAMTEILKLRLHERLREQMSGTYGVNVTLNLTMLPTPQYVVQIEFVCAPDRSEELTQAALAVIDTLQRTPALESELQKFQTAAFRGLEEARHSDGYWYGVIDASLNRKLPFSAIAKPEQYMRGVTTADVQAAAKQYLNLKSYARFDLVPLPSTAITTP